MVGNTFTRLVFSSPLLLSSLVHRGQGPADGRERERTGDQWSMTTIISTSVPLVIQCGFLIENLITSKPADKQTDTHRQTKGGFLLSAGCVAWSVGRWMAGWRAPGWLARGRREDPT